MKALYPLFALLLCLPVYAETLSPLASRGTAVLPEPRLIQSGGSVVRLTMAARNVTPGLAADADKAAIAAPAIGEARNRFASALGERPINEQFDWLDMGDHPVVAGIPEN